MQAQRATKKLPFEDLGERRVEDTLEDLQDARAAAKGLEKSDPNVDADLDSTAPKSGLERRSGDSRGLCLFRIGP